MFTVNVSAGELLDKYSILEIKLERIRDDKKKKCIRAEMDVLEGSVRPLLCEGGNLTLEYRLLKYVNTVIWDLNEVQEVKDAFDGRHIMEENNARFRVKRWINEKVGSALKEVKSYAGTEVWLDAKGECGSHMLNVLLFAQWAMLYHDTVYVVLDGHADDDLLELYREQICERNEDDRIKVVRDSELVRDGLQDVDATLVPREFLEIMVDH